MMMMFFLRTVILHHTLAHRCSSNRQQVSQHPGSIYLEVLPRSAAFPSLKSCQVGNFATILATAKALCCFECLGFTRASDPPVSTMRPYRFGAVLTFLYESTMEWYATLSQTNRLNETFLSVGYRVTRATCQRPELENTPRLPLATVRSFLICTLLCVHT